MSDPEMRVALVGAGYFGRFHADAWARIEGAELVAVVDSDSTTAEGLGAPVFADAVEMARALTPDIIDIAVPPAAHLGLIEALAPLCARLICQKPFCRDLAEAERATAVAARGGARLIIHENIRNQPWYAEAARLIRDGAIGDPWSLSFRLRPGDGRGAEAYLARQPYFQKMERFLVHETAIHWIDLFRAIFGEPEGVYADLRRLNPAIRGEDAGIVILDWPDGRRALFDGNRLADHAATDRRRTMGEFLAEGDSGALRIDGEGRIFLRKIEENAEREHRFDWRDRNFGGDCVYISCMNYLDSFRTGAPNPTEAAAYLANLRIEQAIYESAAEGRRVVPG
ncbi:Gfo/Idh/MocA family oxidoreductase [Pikeienuella piscinae]|uniref:Gfo/Idh/MocA family oxidoreductase n=1 Tax=Pikeienuella piscinae TaxID=2748098 RepID=A0A7L5C3N9_9RHOB|nr:Gfo/Idh/MocA family oxidoreductase [Pikeienuella piscinae]QIE56864.1 Gfo/Idh/MocA family oxidoreductase [Pikeienuella piscinae]